MGPCAIDPIPGEYIYMPVSRVVLILPYFYQKVALSGIRSWRISTLYARADPLTRGEVRQQDVWRLNSQAGVFAGDHSSDGEFNVRLDGEQGEANAGGRAGCTRAPETTELSLKQA